jgi:hypothetical protein
MRNEIDIGSALGGMNPGRDLRHLRRLIEAALVPMQTQLLTTGALGIKVAGSVTAASSATITYQAGGKLATKASSDMAVLSGTVTADAFNVYAFSITLGGTAVTRMGLEGATLAAVKFPPIPEEEAVLGFVIINPTGTGDFVGGTTDLDDATVVPTASYINTPYPFNPYLR